MAQRPRGDHGNEVRKKLVVGYRAVLQERDRAQAEQHSTQGDRGGEENAVDRDRVERDERGERQWRRGILERLVEEEGRAAYSEDQYRGPASPQQWQGPEQQ